jgi:hypothetical protein
MAARPKVLDRLEKIEEGTKEALQTSLKRAIQAVRAEIILLANKKQVATPAEVRSKGYSQILSHFKDLEKSMTAQLVGLVDEVAKDANGQAEFESDSIVQYDPERTQRYFQLVNPTNEKQLAAVYTNKMAGSVIGSLQRAYTDEFRQHVISGTTNVQFNKALQSRWSAEAADGNNFRFVDNSGRAWENARYFQMLVRTNALNVWNASFQDSLAEAGYDLARVSRDGDPDCDICAAWEGLIIDISGKYKGKYPTEADARAAGVFHPNCTHRLEYIDKTLDKDIIKQQANIKPQELTREELIKKREEIANA